MIYIINLISVILDCNIILLFFKKFVEKPPTLLTYFYRIIICILFYILNIYNNFQGDIIISSLFILFISFNANITIYKKTLYTIELFMIMGIIEVISVCIVAKLFNIDIIYLNKNIILYTFALFISKYITYIIIKIMTQFEKQELLFNKVKLLILLLSTFTISIMFYFVSKLIYQSQNNEVLFLGLVLMIVLIVSYTILIESYNWYSKLVFSQKELEIYTQQFEFQKDYNKQIFENQQEIKKIRHDLRNNLIGIQGLLLNGNINKAIMYINELYDPISNIDNKITYTNNPYIDSIILAKKTDAINHGIEFIVIVDFFQLGCINEKDLGILIGCAIDNAIEATLKVDQVLNKRFIQISIRQKGMFLCIQIKNPSIDSHINFKKTSKNDLHNLHGFGIKNIQSVSEKYRGSVEYCVIDNIVTFNSILSLH